MEFIKTFGLNPILLLAQIVNFLILLYLLNRFLYKPVLTLLQEREKRIQKGIDDAKQAQELKEFALIEQQRILKEAKTQASQIMIEARQEIANMRASFEEKLKLERQQMLEEGKENIASEGQKMERQLMGKVLQIAVELVEKTLSTALRSEDRKKISSYAQKQILKHLPS